MSFWKIIKGLNYRQLTSLFVWFLKHPLYMIATINATLQTFRISEREFPKIHGKHNKANAFRHALWNILIAKKCAKFSKNNSSVINWTKQITDWHEEFSPNEKLAEAMDLYNNRVGRTLYESNRDLEINQIVDLVKRYMENAVKISKISDVENFNQLVYIED